MRGLDYFRQKIQELELKAPPEKSDFYREYTKFLIEKMKTVQYLDSEEKAQDVNVFFANPERAIAKMKEDRNFKLPLMSISIDDIDEDVDRRKTSSNLEISTVWDVKKQRAIRIVSKAAKPINLSFTINIWSKYLEDVNQIIESVMLMFNPSMDFKTKDSSNSQAFIQQVTDNSVMSVGDQKDRVIRKMIIITAEAYLSNPKYLITSTGEIERMGVDFEFIDDPDSNYQAILSVGSDSAVLSDIDQSNADYIDGKARSDGFAVSAFLNQQVVLSDGFTMLYNIYVPAVKSLSGQAPFVLYTPGTGTWRNHPPYNPSTGFLRSAGPNSLPGNPRDLHITERLLAEGYAVAVYDVRAQSTPWSPNEGGGAQDSSLFFSANLIPRTNNEGIVRMVPWEEFGGENFGVRELLDVFEVRDHIVSGLELPWTGDINLSAIGHIGTSLGGMAGGAAAAYSGRAVPWYGISSTQNEFEEAGALEYGFPIDWGYTSSSVFSEWHAVSIGSFIADYRVFQQYGARFPYLSGPIRMLDLTCMAPRYLDKYIDGLSRDSLDDFIAESERRAPLAYELSSSIVPATFHFSYDDRQRSIDMSLDAMRSYTAPKFYLATTSHHNAPKNYHSEKLMNDISVGWFNQYLKGEARDLPTASGVDYYMMETPNDVSSFQSYDHVRTYHESNEETLPGLTDHKYAIILDAGGRKALHPMTGPVNSTPYTQSIEYTIKPGATTVLPNTSSFVDKLLEFRESRDAPTSTQMLNNMLEAVQEVVYLSPALDQDLLFMGEVSATLEFNSTASGAFGFDLVDYNPSGSGELFTPVRVVTTGSHAFDETVSQQSKVLKSRYQCYTFKKGHQIAFILKNHTLYRPNVEPALRIAKTTFEVCPYFNNSIFQFEMYNGLSHITIPMKPI
tara:strand:- start:2216 stop:4915 length:2700 start_codon:yes stop_codon:yes gene_type:complete